MPQHHKNAFDYIVDNVQYTTGQQSSIRSCYQTLAYSLETQLISGPEKSVAMRKLLESYDAAMRSSA